MKRCLVIILGSSLVALAACTAAPTSTPPIVSPTRAPFARQTAIATPAVARTAPLPTPTNAPNPTSTRAAAPTLLSPSATLSTGRLPLPTGLPVASWHDFPIMPSAIAGQDNDKGGYYYSIKASPQQIQDYYTRKMETLGWDLLTTGTKSDDPGYLFLLFHQANYPTFSVFVSVQGDVTVVFVAN